MRIPARTHAPHNSSHCRQIRNEWFTRLISLFVRSQRSRSRRCCCSAVALVGRLRCKVVMSNKRPASCGAIPRTNKFRVTFPCSPCFAFAFVFPFCQIHFLHFSSHLAIESVAKGHYKDLELPDARCTTTGLALIYDSYDIRSPVSFFCCFTFRHDVSVFKYLIIFSSWLRRKGSRMIWGQAKDEMKLWWKKRSKK